MAECKAEIVGALEREIAGTIERGPCGLAVYVAGPSAEIARCEAMIEALRAEGIRVTHDWPAVMRGHARPDGELEPSILAAEAEADLEGVRSADLVIVLTHERWTAGPGTSAGAMLEAGAALGLGIPVLVAGGRKLHALFGALAAHEVTQTVGVPLEECDARAVTWAAAYAAGWARSAGLAPPVRRPRPKAAPADGGELLEIGGGS